MVLRVLWTGWAGRVASSRGTRKMTCRCQLVYAQRRDQKGTHGSLRGDLSIYASGVSISPGLHMLVTCSCEGRVQSRGAMILLMAAVNPNDSRNPFGIPHDRPKCFDANRNSLWALSALITHRVTVCLFGPVKTRPIESALTQTALTVLLGYFKLSSSSSLSITNI
jgi:hypothetical protein